MEFKSIVPIVPSRQKWVCMSFVSDKKTCSTTAIRIGGVFNTEDEACTHAKAIREIDIYNHVFVGEMGEWLPYDPNPQDENKVKESNYMNSDLDDLMKSRIQNHNDAIIHHEERKQNEIKNNLNDNLQHKQKIKQEFEKKLGKAKTKDEMTSITKQLENLNKQINNLEETLKDKTQDNTK